MTEPRTLFEKIWTEHVIEELGDDYALLHVDRNILHDLLGRLVFEPLDDRARGMPCPDLTFATIDHGIDTQPGRDENTSIPGGRAGVLGLREKAKQYGIRLFDLGDVRQGIVHVAMPEHGVALPGCLLVCGDSHTSTIGGLGALAWGVGLTEIAHVLATQTIVAKKPRTMCVNFSGQLAKGVTAKDMVLALIGKLGAKAGNGFVVEYTGTAIRSLSIEGRLTICNMAIEMAARYGIIAADDTTFDYLYGREFSPKGQLWDKAIEHWRSLPTDEGARFDKCVTMDVTTIGPQITWGTSPQDTMDITQMVPEPADAPNEEQKKYIQGALDYTGLEPGKPIEGTPIDVAFIGSCTNSRLSDLRRAAKIVRGHYVPDSVRAWIVPGSATVKRDAEAEGLDLIFQAAGFEWREPGCSMCVALGGDSFPPGSRSISSTNRNFENRQGLGVRTHLASPEMVAAAAINGKIVDVRKLVSS